MLTVDSADIVRLNKERDFRDALRGLASHCQANSSASWQHIKERGFCQLLLAGRFLQREQSSSGPVLACQLILRDANDPLASRTLQCLQEESRVSLNAVDSLDALLSDVNKGLCLSLALLPAFSWKLVAWHANLVRQQVIGILSCTFPALYASLELDVAAPLLRQAVSYLSFAAERPPGFVQPGLDGLCVCVGIDLVCSEGGAGAR